MGLQFLLLRSLAMLPGPVLVGKIIDSTCVAWKYNECGTKTNCAEYDLDQLSLLLSVALSAASGNKNILIFCDLTSEKGKLINQHINYNSLFGWFQKIYKDISNSDPLFSNP